MFTIGCFVFCNNSFAQTHSDSDLSRAKDVGVKQFPSSIKVFLLKARSDISKVISNQIQEAIDNNYLK